MIYKNPFKRILHASIYSLQGIFFALRHEQAFRYEFIVLLIIFAVLIIFSVNFAWCLILIIGWLFVMCFELMNSAIEKLFDLIDENYNPKIKAGKDMLSATVFIMICANIILWCVFLNQILKNFFLCYNIK